MSLRNYREFVLIVDRVKTGATGVVEEFQVQVFDSPVGQGEQRETVSVPNDLATQIRLLEKRALDDDVETQMDLGESLAALLLPESAREMWFESIARLADDEGLRLRLRLVDELSDFPWEYVFIKRGHGERTSLGFLALDPRISIVRHEAVRLPGDWFKAPDHRRVVVAMASPQPYARYPKLAHLPREQQLLKEALGDIDGVDAIFLPDYSDVGEGQLPGATLADVTCALEEPTHVFHFSGHGEFAAEMGPAFGSKIGKGVIVLSNTNNEALRVGADRFAESLHSRGTRLVVLGACETGRRDGRNVWSGVVAALMQAGIPAVVAMQFAINDRLAAAFSGAFYRALIAGHTVDAAVAAGRVAIRAETLSKQPNIRDWGAPVFYLRAPGGQVFQAISNESARAKAQQQVDNIVTQQVAEIVSSGKLVGAVVGPGSSGSVTVEQKVEEEIKGLVVGAKVYNTQGGNVSVKQKANVLSGTMIGLTLGDAKAAQGLSELEEDFALPLTCSQCGVELEASCKYCNKCGTKVDS